MNYESILNRKIKTLFPDSNIKTEVINTLYSYGDEKYEQEPIRVRLAVLKLSRAKLEQVKLNTKYAKEDFRDVLTWAESPNLGKIWPVPDGPKKQKLIQTDKTEYEEWLRM